MQLASSTITRWWWAPDRCREQDQELLAVVQERFHSAANNRPPACSAAFGPVRHLGYGQLVDSPGIADRNRRTANRETRAAAGPLLPARPPVFHTAHGECGPADRKSTRLNSSH